MTPREPAAPAPRRSSEPPGPSAEPAGREAPVAGRVASVRTGRVGWRAGRVCRTVAAAGGSAAVPRTSVRGTRAGKTPAGTRGREPSLRPRSSGALLRSYRRTPVHLSSRKTRQRDGGERAGNTATEERRHIKTLGLNRKRKHYLVCSSQAAAPPGGHRDK